jgi:hypothetical protein
MASKDIYTSPLGLSVSKGDWEGAEWTITGYPRKEFTIREFDSAYEFEDFVKEKIASKDIDFDSEFCQFFAYARSEARAVAYVKLIEGYFQNVSSLLK